MYLRIHRKKRPRSWVSYDAEAEAYAAAGNFNSETRLQQVAIDIYPSGYRLEAERRLVSYERLQPVRYSRYQLSDLVE